MGQGGEDCQITCKGKNRKGKTEKVKVKGKSEMKKLQKICVYAKFSVILHPK
jgi:hypothetical protein